MPRVLKKGHFRFSERLHGGVELTGREIRIAPDPNLGIEHFSYLSIEHYLDKVNRYTSVEAAQLKSGGQSIDWRNAIAHMVHDLWLYYERNRGDLDGRHGWILAWLSGQYRWLSHAKLLDLESTSAEPSAQVVPESLDDVLRVMEQELEGLRSSSPQLSLGVVLRSPIWDLSGYADEGRCIAKSLSFGDRRVVVEEIPWSETRCRVSRTDRALLRSMQNGKRSQSNLTITNCIPTRAVPDKSAALNVFRTTFETDRIPAFWIPHLDQFDEIWVISKHNERAFIRSGVAPEKIRCVPSFLDTEIYRPDQATIELPDELQGRFVFLSVFDWQYRKGWDLLLKAYCQTFVSSDDVALILKISRANGISLQSVFDQANDAINFLNQSLTDRPDIVIVDDNYSTQEMANLYRSVNAFVLPSRGEGWGRPYMEAMASGLPTIGTRASGNVDFMNSENSILVDATLVDVPIEAVNEIRVYEGHKWFEPNLDALSESMRKIVDDETLRNRISRNALEHIRSNHNIIRRNGIFPTCYYEAENRFRNANPGPPKESQIRLTWEGEFFAAHSFSNINEQLVDLFLDDDRFAIKLERHVHNPTFDNKNPRSRIFDSFMHREFEAGPDIVVRHAYPPIWSHPTSGRWIHIQPWEFGHLPKDWIDPLQNDVDEIWIPTNYVKKVYIDSRISADKIFVIPWGVAPDIFNTDVPARILATSKSFRFVFVGGTIYRKGFDRVLDAFREEFGPREDVCLVVKDLGADTFYRNGNLRDAVIKMRDDPNLPEILYFNEDWTAGQLASLYSACNCLVMPYRGEGFGLPILEAMACGVPAIVPRGGASDDFVSESTGLLLDSQAVQTNLDWELIGPALELEIDLGQLRQKMRFAFENRERLIEIGRLAAESVRTNFTWRNTKEKMCERILAIHSQKKPVSIGKGINAMASEIVTACVRTLNNERTIADCLSRLVPFVDEILILDAGSTDRTTRIAAEYPARIIATDSVEMGDEDFERNVVTEWRFSISPSEILAENDAAQIIPFLDVQPELATEVTMQTSTATGKPDKYRSGIRLSRCRKSTANRSTIRNFKSLKSLKHRHQLETAWIFGKGPGLDQFDMSLVGPLRICINESLNLVDNPTFFFAHDEIPIRRVAANWNKECCAILEPERAKFAVDCGIPPQQIYSYLKRSRGDFDSLTDVQEVVESNSLLGMTGTVHSAIHFCKLLGVKSVKLIGFEGRGGYASRLNVPGGGGRHELIRNDSVRLLQMLGLDFEFLDSNSIDKSRLDPPIHYGDLYNKLREHNYHQEEDDTSHLAKHIPWIKQNLDVETVLDVGCSAGKSLELFAERGMMAIGVEVSSVAVSAAQRLGRNVVQGCATELPFADSLFDLVCSADVFEHLHPSDAEKACHEACRVAIKYVFLKIAEKEDITEKWQTIAGHPLHLTTHPIEWWKQKFSTFGRIMRLERELICVKKLDVQRQ